MIIFHHHSNFIGNIIHYSSLSYNADDNAESSYSCLDSRPSSCYGLHQGRSKLDGSRNSVDHSKHELYDVLPPEIGDGNEEKSPEHHGELGDGAIPEPIKSLRTRLDKV
ncbi:hypothetical protein L2E82_31301 [Cichorium intybus]|uniref:Uncharacterized protein n=1 Tax=Cichorium intybus TaxID=13427 RepID=A0ACB9D2J2_CICIN|nr:hypothetical protein L2E82_31301 [Cichorium intybus]